MTAKRDSKQMGAVKTTPESQASDRDALRVSGDYSSDALFAAKPSKKPSSLSVGSMKRVTLPAPVPPPPPVIASPLDSSNDDFGLDLDFSRPIEASLPELDEAFSDGPSVETTIEYDEPSPSHLQPIDPIAASASDVMPDDAFEFADATEVWDASALDSIATDPGARISSAGLEVDFPLSPSVPVPALPVYPSVAPKVDIAARRAERAERVRALIASREFADAMDLIELLRASADDGLADELERECQLAQNPLTQSHKPLPRVLSAPLPEPPRPTPSAPTRTPIIPHVPSPPSSRSSSGHSVVGPLPPPPAPVASALPVVEPLDELGGLGAVLSVVANSAAIRTLDLDHRAGFLLSLIDGFSTVEDLLDLANMPSELTLLLLADLKRRGLVK